MTDIHPPLLLIDTSTRGCSVAVAAAGTIISQRVSHVGNSHAANIGVFVQEVLTEATGLGAKPSIVALSSGPGSYTGLSIGSSIAKGLCFGLGIPLVSVPTLELIAEAARPLSQPDWLICPMIDARRMEVYTALFDSKGKALTDTLPLVIDNDSFSEELKKRNILFVGDGAEKCRPFLSHPNAHFSENVIYPLALYMLHPALSRIET